MCILSFCLLETSSLATWTGTTTSTALLWGKFHNLLLLREGDGCSPLFYDLQRQLLQFLVLTDVHVGGKNGDTMQVG